MIKGGVVIRAVIELIVILRVKKSGDRLSPCDGSRTGMDGGTILVVTNLIKWGVNESLI